MIRIIDRFLKRIYPLFRRYLPLQTFKYAACGGANALFGLFTYVVGYKWIFAGRVFDFGFFAFKPHMAALFLSSFITFLIGFWLNKFVVFTTSYLRGRIQLFRYFLSFAFNLVLNYLMLKLLVEFVQWDAVLSQVITIAVVIGVSYLTQKYFTFREQTGERREEL